MKSIPTHFVLGVCPRNFCTASFALIFFFFLGGSINLRAQTISTVVGNGTASYSGDGGAATAATLHQVTDITCDAAGNWYICDQLNHVIRKVSTSGIISTIAGTGTSGFSGDGGAATSARINNPTCIAVNSAGVVYFSDNGNNRVRAITSGIISTVCGNGSSTSTGDGNPASAATVYFPYGIAVDSANNLYIDEGNGTVIRKITASTGIISRYAGVAGSSGFSGDGGAATSALLHSANAIYMDVSNNLFIADNGNHRIRMVNSSGIISTVAGSGSGPGFAGDGGPATAARLRYPAGITKDAAGNLYICDAVNYRVRVVNTSGIITTYAGSGSSTFGGDGGLASAATVGINYPQGVHVDHNGNLLIADILDNRIRMVSNNHIPVFANGERQALAVCVNSTATSINTLLQVNDTDAGQTETWSLYLSPVHGSASVAFSGTSTGGVITPTGLTYTPTASYSGTDSFSVQISDGTLTRYTKILVTINPSPNAGAITGPTGVCVGNNITLVDTSGGGSGTWNSFSGAVTVGSGGVITGVAAGSATISYTLTNSCGSSTTTHSVVVSPAPFVGSVTGPTSLCVGASISLSDTTVGGAWSSGTSSVATVNSSGVVVGVSAGTAVISYSVTNSCGSVSASRTLTVNAGPSTPGIITGTTSICTGTSSTLSDATTGGTWNSTSTGIATINASGVVTGVSPGTTVISYTVTNSCGSAARTTTVVVTSGSTAGTISGASTVCAGATTTFTNTTTGGTWSSSNASIASINSSGVITGVAAGAATITYTVTSGCGSATTTRSITVNPASNAGTISGAATVCTGTTITLTSSVSGGTWTSSAPSIASVSTGGIVLPISAGSVTISYAVSGTCGSAIATKAVAVSSAPVVGSISGASTVCAALSTTLTDTAIGGTWSSSNTSVATVSSTGTVTGVSAGSVTISYAKTNTCGTASAAKGITVGSLPSAGTLSGASAVCTGTTITLSSTATGGTWLSSNTAVATVVASTGVVRGVTAGTVNITYYVSSTCATAIATRSITVAASGSAGTITGVASVCRGASATLTNSASGGTWSSSNASIASISSTGVVTGIAAGSVTITYTTTSGCGSAFATKAFTVNALPYVSVISGSSTVCAGTTTIMTDSFSGGGWISSNTAAATITSSGVVTGISAGSTTITYFITNGCGTSVKTKSLTVTSATAGTLSGPSSVAVGASIVLTATVSGGTWTSLNTSIATVSTSGIVRGVATGTDTVVYTVSTSCGAATVSKVISVTAHRGFASVEESTDNIKVYPNPNSGSFTLELPEGISNATVMITDITGKVIEVKSNSEPTMYFDMRQYAAGAYLIRVSADGKMYSQKVIIE